MTPLNSPTDADLAAYVAGHVSAVRAKEIERWAASNPDNATQLASVRMLLGNAEAAPWERARMWSNIERAIVDAPQKHAAPRKRILPSAWIAAAAGIVLLAGGGFYFAHRGSLPQTVREYATGRGERATVRLSDGTQVTLAAESRLRIPASFGRRTRVVELNGEAEFDVVHDAARPFSVRAGRALVVDVGTRFDLRAYPEDADARVAVAEGAVTLGVDMGPPGSAARAEGVLVRHGRVARLEPGGAVRDSAMMSDMPYFAWARGAGVLVFERTRLREVLGTIGHWYGLDVRVADSALANRLVTAELSTQASPEMVRALAAAVGATVTEANGAFTLRMK